MTETTDIPAPLQGGTYTYEQIASLVYNTPLLIHPNKAEVIAWILSEKTGVTAQRPGPEASAFVGKARGSTWYREIDGTAIIPIIGSLVNRGSWLGTYSGMVSYEGISARLREAAADADVDRIVLDIQSPGGEAAGMMALADQVRAVRESKPVIAIVNDMAASAAYGIASQANRILVSETSVTGSIGVVLVHLDHSGAMQQRGVAATLIYAGRHKVDGHPFGPLPESVKADLQAEVHQLYEKFAAKVAQGRPGLSIDAIRATEARVFRGQDGITAGLADEAGTLFDVLEGRAGQLPRSYRGSTLNRRISMSKDKPEPGAENPGIPQAAHEAAVKSAREEGEKTGHARGVAAERERISSIMKLETAGTRQKQALTIALTTDMTADQAKALLEASPAEAKTETVVPPKDRATGPGLQSDLPQPSARDAWAKVVERQNKRVA